MNIFVTGQPGVGKTTLVVKVVQKLRELRPDVHCHGFFTEEVRVAGERIGFDFVSIDGAVRGPLARIEGVNAADTDDFARNRSSSSGSGIGGRGRGQDVGSWRRRGGISGRGGRGGQVHRVGKYLVDSAAFQNAAVPLIEVTASASLCVIDEVGKMELFSPSFPSVVAALDSPCPVLGTIPVPRYGRDVAEVAQVRERKDVTVHMITKDNRNAVADLVLKSLLEVL